LHHQGPLWQLTVINKFFECDLCTPTQKNSQSEHPTKKNSQSEHPTQKYNQSEHPTKKNSQSEHSNQYIKSFVLIG